MIWHILGLPRRPLPRLACRTKKVKGGGRTVAGAVWGAAAFESVLNCELSTIHWTLHQNPQTTPRVSSTVCACLA